MGRKYTNESYLCVNIDNSGNKKQEDYATKVKVPNYNEVIIKVNINADKNCKPHYAETSVEICNNFQHTKEEVTEDLKKKGYEVIRFDPVKTQVQDRCPDCGLAGRPKFDRRPNAYDYHSRSNYSSKDGDDYETARGTKTKFKTGRDDDFILTYSHKICNKVKKCTIGKLDKNHLTIIKNGKVNEKMIEHIFPFYIKSIKNA